MTTTASKLKDIILLLKWGNISKDYFGFSGSWIYQRLNGYDGNGNPADFTEEQRQTLRDALKDIAERINKAADSIGS